MLALLLEPNGDFVNDCNMSKIKIPVRVNYIIMDLFIAKSFRSSQISFIILAISGTKKIL